MSEKSEALRLTDALDAWDGTLMMPAGWRQRTSAELRRLHEENERLHQINQSHEMKLSVRGYEIQIADLEAQRDALLEALRRHVELHDGDCICEDCAAIKAVEEGK